MKCISKEFKQMGCCSISNKSKFEELCILTVYFNASKNERRKKLHIDFIKRFKQFAGIKIITIECAFDDDPFELIDNKRDSELIRIRAHSKIWLKENLLNIALKKLFKNKSFRKYCRYVAWIDDDIEFVENDWVSKLRESLQKFQIVQLFKEALFLDNNGNVLEKHTSFGYYYSTKMLKLENNEYPHPGYGWCTTSENLFKIGQLFDYGILGNGDKHMAYALIGDYLESFPKNLCFNENYKTTLKNWQNKAINIFQKKVGFVDVTIKHH